MAAGDAAALRSCKRPFTPFCSTQPCIEDDNPTDPDALTDPQKSRAIEFTFDQTSVER